MSNDQYPRANSEGRKRFEDLPSAIAFRENILRDFDPAGYGTVAYIEPGLDGPVVYWRIHTAG